MSEPFDVIAAPPSRPAPEGGKKDLIKVTVAVRGET
jgi:hypothetical protein